MSVVWSKKLECAFDLNRVLYTANTRDEQLNLLMSIQNTIKDGDVVPLYGQLREIPVIAEYIDAQLEVLRLTKKLNEHRFLFVQSAQLPYFHQEGIFHDIRNEQVLSIYDQMLEVLIQELIDIRSKFKNTVDDTIAKEREILDELEFAKHNEKQKKIAYNALPPDKLRDDLVTWYGGVGVTCSSCHKIIIFDKFPQLFCCC